MHMSEDKPIGWWVRHLDRTLEEALDRALAEADADRRQWQLLNVAEAGGSVDELAPFFATSADADEAARELVDRGWLETAGDRLGLTVDGAAARERLTAIVRAQRERSMVGIAPAEYAATVDVLRRMAVNLAAG